MVKAVTLKDVAERAGVSTATVARVIHEKGYVAAGTRLRVESVLLETGYQVNVVAQGLRKQKSLAFGHSLSRITDNPFFAQIALGVEEGALKEGYAVFVFNVQGDPDRERIGVESFIRRRVDAVIFTTPRSAGNVELVLEAGIPVVQVERLTSVPTNAVLIDNYIGAKQAMHHLLELGHSRIGFIGGHSSSYPYSTARNQTVEEERLAGYQDALNEYGIEVEERLVHLVKYLSIDDPYNSQGRLQMQKLLELEDRPTAVFVASDILASRALQTLYEADLRVPNDISLVGFDDTLAARLSPPLTTVAIPMLEVGRAAASLALTAAVPQSTPQLVTLSTCLVIRESTSAPPV